jgi:Leucine-rich repeat (LRR) protein
MENIYQITANNSSVITMEIRITGTTTEGRNFSKKIDTEITKLGLTSNIGSNKLQSIDLEPLKQCSELTELALTNNQLQSIDLISLYQ